MSSFETTTHLNLFYQIERLVLFSAGLLGAIPSISGTGSPKHGTFIRPLSRQGWLVNVSPDSSPLQIQPANDVHEAAPSGVTDLRTLQIILAWLCLFAALLVLRSHTYWGYIYHDDGLFLYAGQAAASGKLAYRDFWDHKPPGVFYLHAPVLWLFPFSLAAVKIFDALWVSISATLLFLTLRWHFNFRAVLIATVSYILFLSMPDPIRGGGLTEECGLVFQGVFYLLVLTHPEATRRHAWLAGVFLGCAMQCRQTFALDFPILILWLWYLRQEQNRPVVWWIKGCIAAGFGILVPEIVISAWFWLHGAWHDYFTGSYLFNVLYVQRGEAGRSWQSLFHSWLGFTTSTGPYLVAPLAASVLLPWMNPMHRRLLLVIALGYIGDLAATMMSGEFYAHYYVQAAWPMCIALGLITHIGIWALNRWWKSKSRRYLPAAACALGICGGCLWLMGLGLHSAYADVRKAYMQAAEEDGRWAAQREIGRAIAALTAPDETIQLLGRSPNSCYFLSGRHASSRYYHNTPIFKSKFEGDVSEELRKTFMDDLRANPPALFVIGEGDTKRPWRELQLIEQHIPELRAILDSDYIALEEVTEIPEDWWWYPYFCRFFIKRDGAQQRIQHALEQSES